MREDLGSTTAGVVERPEPTWWASRNPGLRYVRCELPARRLGGSVRFIREAIADGTITSHTGVQVFQLPATRDTFDLIRSFRKRGQRVLVEFDDDYTEWHEGYVNMLKGAVWSAPWTQWDKDAPDRWSPSLEMARACAQEADAVIVSTPFLGLVYRRWNPNVFVCRNSVEPADWPELQPRTDGEFRVVFAASPNPRDTRRIRPAMEWVASRKDGEAVVIGQKVDWKGVRSVDWVTSLPVLREVLVKLAPDVGLRPLELTRFAAGKSDLKVLEYAMCGALSIVTPGRPYADWQGIVGFAHTADEFLSEVKLAYQDRQLTRGLADVARNVVLTSRTIEVEAQSWASALRSSSAAQS